MISSSEIPKSIGQPERRFKKITNIVGFDYSSASSEIPDNKCRMLINYISRIGRRLVKIPGWTDVTLSTSLPADILRMYVVYVGASTGNPPVPHLIMFLTNGSCYKHNLSAGTTASVWTTATFSNPRLVQWKQERIVVVDPVAGIKDWDGTTPTNTSAVKANFATVWEGRLFLLRTDTNALAWTAPDTYDDFNTGNGAGVVELTDPNIRGQVTGFAAVSGILYIFAENAINTASNLRQSGSTTVFDIKPLKGNRGCKYPDSIAVYENAVYFMDEKGVWEVIGFSSRRVSEPDIDGILPYLNNASFAPVGFVGTLYNLDFYGLLVSVSLPGSNDPEKWLLCFYNDGWFVVKYDINTTFITTGTEVSGSVLNLACAADEVYNFFDEASEEEITSIIETKTYEEGNEFLDKQMNRFGLNLGFVDGTLLFECSVFADEFLYTFDLGATFSAAITWVNDDGDTIQWQNGDPDDVNFTVGTAEASLKRRAHGRGKGLIFRIEETSNKRYTIDAILAEYFFRARW